MGRREKPLDPEAGPVQRFACELRALRHAAGTPTYRVMAQEAGYSVAALTRAAGGEKLPTLAVTLAYVRACGGDAEHWERRWRAAARDQAELALDRDREGADPPYRGLARFEPGDQELFFGRERLTDALVRTACEHRFTTVVGPSGSGKSSLLRAGLVSRLQNARGPEPRPAVIRILTPGPRPAHEHAELFVPAAGAGDTWVVVDQFEEVFTLCRDPRERARFIDLLLTARKPESRLRVVLGVRVDFYGRFLEYEELAAVAREAGLPVGPMSAAELRQAITKPAAAQGLIVERTLTERLIEETAAEPGGLPLLSHALLETWHRRRGRTLTLEGYEAVGGIHGAIAQSAERLYSRLTPPQADAARRILLRLITPGDGTPDTRRPVDRAELPDSDDIRQVLDRLAQARLITLAEGTVDLAHEALITAWPRLRGWVQESRERLLVHRRLTEAATAWAQLDHDPGALYRGTRLTLAVDHFPAGRRDELTGLERSFLAACTHARDQEQHAAARITRRLRRSTAALSVLLVLALVAGLVAWRESRGSDRERRNAVAAQRMALSRQLAAQSAALLDSDPDRASRLAVRAYRTEPTLEATNSLYSAAALPLKRRLSDLATTVTSLAFNPAGHTLITQTYDTLQLRDATTGKVRVTLPRPRTFLPAAAVFSPDGRVLAVNRDNGTVQLRDARTGALRTTLAGQDDMVSSMAFGPDGRTLATGSEGGTVRLWNTETGRSRATLAAGARVSSMAVSPDGRTLAAGCDDGAVRLWDARTHQRRTALTGPTEPVTSLVFAEDSRHLAVRGYKAVRFWDTDSGRLHATRTTHNNVLDAWGRTLVTSGAGHTVRLWDMATGRLRRTLDGHANTVTSAAFGPGGRTLASSGSDGTVRLWDTATGKSLATLTRHADVVSVMAFAPDGHTLATSSDSTVRLWDATAGARRATLAGHTQSVSALAFSPGGGTLATSGFDDTVKLWDTATATVRRTLTRRAQAVSALAFSPDGRTLATGSLYGTVQLWDTATGRLRTTLSTRAAVTALAFSPDGRTLATSSDDNRVRPSRLNATAVTPLIRFVRAVRVAPVAMSRSVTVWSPLPVATVRPSALNAITVAGSACRTGAARLAPVAVSHRRTVPS